jgi:hypothetical protein
MYKVIHLEKHHVHPTATDASCRWSAPLTHSKTLALLNPPERNLSIQSSACSAHSCRLICTPNSTAYMHTLLFTAVLFISADCVMPAPPHTTTIPAVAHATLPASWPALLLSLMLVLYNFIRVDLTRCLHCAQQ